MSAGESVAQVASCNICGSGEYALLLHKDGHDVVRCASCGLAFTYPQPSMLSEQYDSTYFDLYRRRHEFRLRRADSRLRRIELLMAPGRLLDIGCSLGYFVEAANARGWHASGVEISPYAAAEARSLGLDVRTGTLDAAAYEDGSFDCVTMWDVLEHVPDPTRHMGEVRRILAPGGMVVVGTPNLGHALFRLKRENWRHLKPAEHIFYFTASTLARLFEKTGFAVARPPLWSGRSFDGSAGAAVKCGLSRLVQLNDVITMYGVRHDL